MFHPNIVPYLMVIYFTINSMSLSLDVWTVFGYIMFNVYRLDASQNYCTGAAAPTPPLTMSCIYDAAQIL